MLLKCARCGEDFLSEADYQISKPVKGEWKIYCFCEVRDLRKALQFYAEPKHWSAPYERQGLIGYQVKAPLHQDGGKVARSALNHRY